MRLGSALAAACIAILLAMPASAVRYRIDTFAGSGETGSPSDVGDGLPATLGHLDAPTGLARDRRGNVYVADHNHARVRRVRTTGRARIIATIAGTGVVGSGGDGGPAREAQLTLPTGVSVARGGQLLVTDAGSDLGANTVRRIDAKGVIHAFAGVGDEPPGDAGDAGPAVRALLHTPLRTAVAPGGAVYIVELNNHRVRLVGADGTIATFAGRGVAGDAGDGGAAVDALLDQPAGVAVDRRGTVFIADFGNERIRAVTPDGVIHALAGTGVRTGSIDGEGGDPADDLHDDGPAAAATFFKPTGLALDRAGGLLVADQGNSRIRRLAPAPDGGLGPASTVTTIVGNGEPGFAGDGGDARAARLLIPTDVLPLSRGRFVVADRGNNRLRLVVPVAADDLCSVGCTDGNPCTVDRCDPVAGCRHEPSPEARACARIRRPRLAGT